MTGVGEPGQAGDTDAAVGQVFDADVQFDADGRRTVRLTHVESGREAVIMTGASRR